MVNCCACPGCTNTSASGHRMHFFPDRQKNLATFRAWVSFVRLLREDFTASSVSRYSMICGAHFTPEDYSSSDMMETLMGFKAPERVRLNKGAVPSILPPSSRKHKTSTASGNQHQPLSTPSHRDMTDDGRVHSASHPLDLSGSSRPSFQLSGEKSDSVFEPPPVKKRKDQFSNISSTNPSPKKRKLLQSLSEAVDLRSPAAGPSVSEPLCDSDICRQHVHSIESLIEALQAENQSLRGNSNNDSHVFSLTGLPTFSILRALFHSVSPHLKPKPSLSPFQQFLLTLMKLHSDLSFDVLAFYFGIDASTASRVFRRCVRLMFCRMVPALIVWPEREALRKTLPDAFRCGELENTVCIVDSLEVSVEKPCVTISGECGYSKVEAPHDLRYLIAMSPQGSISFISEGWGRSGDRLITQDSHFLSRLCPGDLVLADGGLVQTDGGLNGQQSVESSHNGVNVRAFTPGGKGLVPVELASGRSLASLRTHVERVSGVVRQKFTLLQSTVPASFTETDKANNTMFLDQIVKVCCALTNVCTSVVPSQ